MATLILFFANRSLINNVIYTNIRTTKEGRFYFSGATPLIKVTSLKLLKKLSYSNVSVYAKMG